MVAGNYGRWDMDAFKLLRMRLSTRGWEIALVKELQEPGLVYLFSFSCRIFSMVSSPVPASTWPSGPIST